MDSLTEPPMTGPMGIDGGMGGAVEHLPGPAPSPPTPLLPAAVGAAWDPVARVLAHDAHWLAVDKPANWLAVPGRGPQGQDCVWSRLQAHWGPLWVVHRLDMATSGVLLFARTPAAQTALARHFAQRHVHKRYMAVVEGHVQPDHGVWDAPLMPDWPQRPRQKVDAQGKAALTHFSVHHRWVMHAPGQAACAATQLILTPVTGRTHQLRVHAWHAGHAIWGDALYADPSVRARAPRLLLHAEQLRFPHPTEDRWCEVEAPLPWELTLGEVDLAPSLALRP